MLSGSVQKDGPQWVTDLAEALPNAPMPAEIKEAD